MAFILQLDILWIEYWSVTPAFRARVQKTRSCGWLWKLRKLQLLFASKLWLLSTYYGQAGHLFNFTWLVILVHSFHFSSKQDNNRPWRRPRLSVTLHLLKAKSLTANSTYFTTASRQHTSSMEKRCILLATTISDSNWLLNIQPAWRAPLWSTIYRRWLLIFCSNKTKCIFLLPPSPAKTRSLSRLHIEDRKTAAWF